MPQRELITKQNKLEPFFERWPQVGAHYVNRNGEMKQYLETKSEARNLCT